MDRKRFADMDVFKGILIVLVVVGHLIPQFIAEISWMGWRVLFFAIYGFHMQAFAFIAGFCSAKLLGPLDATARHAFIRRRAERLLVPYFFWGGLYFAARMAMPFLAAESYDISRAWQFLLGYNPDGALWFLWTLFVATGIIWGGRMFCSLGRLTVAAALTGVLALRTQPWTALPVAVNALPLFVSFFAFGLLVRRHYDAVRPLFGNPVFCIVMGVLWCLLLSLHPMAAVELPPWYLLGATSLFGTIAFLSLSIQISDADLRLKTPLVFLSAYAMEIFILAEPVKVASRTVFRRMGWPVPISIFVMFILMLVVPIVLTRYVLRNSWLQFLLLGKRKGTVRI